MAQGFLTIRGVTTSNGALAGLDDVVSSTLAFFEGPGRTGDARFDRWEAHDVLMHFIYFHEATAWGIQSVGFGGPFWTCQPIGTRSTRSAGSSTRERALMTS